MRTNFLSMRHIKPIYVYYALIMSLFTGCMNFPADDYRENLTLEEAQSLVSFPICVPGNIPPEADPTPNIIYQSDWANVPEEKYIRMQYKQIDNQKLSFEVFQRFTNDEEFKYQSSDNLGESRRKRSMVDLLYWMPESDILSDSEIKASLNLIQMEADVFQTDQTVWRLYEIVYPEKYRSTRTHWVKDHVEYRILSILPADEIKKVTQSMMDCPIQK